MGNMRCEKDGSILWMAIGFGAMSDLVGANEDLVVTVEVPRCVWSSLEGDSTSSTCSGSGGRSSALSSETSPTLTSATPAGQPALRQAATSTLPHSSASSVT